MFPIAIIGVAVDVDQGGDVLVWVDCDAEYGGAFPQTVDPSGEVSEVRNVVYGCDGDCLL